MNEPPIHSESSLERELSHARVKLDGLVRNLQGIDRELDDLSAERRQYDLLSEVCTGLQQLDDMGAAGLFWGDAQAPFAEEQLRRARGRMDSFEKRIGEIEDRRHSAIEDIDQAQDQAELLEDDLFELKQLAEEKKREWIVEREVESFEMRPALMPWARGGEDDRRFRKALAAALLLSLLLGVIFPMIDLPFPAPWEAEAVPERLTSLIRDEEPLPLPPKPQARPEETKPELAQESTPETQPKKAPEKQPAAKGILAFREKFSSLADGRTPARLGARARIRDAGEAATGRSQRALVTTDGPSDSGGIDIGSLSRDVGNGGEGIEGVQVARATSSINAIGGSDRPLSDGPGLSRTDEEIQIVFDRHKAALYRLYNRQLRKDPTLKGQMVLRLTIEPDGRVSLCEVQSTDMKAPQLSSQVAGRVKNFDFGAKDGIPAITILYPIDFLPAT
jgi:hypothetical protein